MPRLSLIAKTFFTFNSKSVFFWFRSLIEKRFSQKLLNRLGAHSSVTSICAARIREKSNMVLVSLLHSFFFHGLVIGSAPNCTD